ncbi:MAG: hydroxymethylbilane synthase [Polyangiaceae bacterium]
MTVLTVATRKSALALAQTRAFMQRLTAAHPGLELKELHVVTTGDRIQDRALSEIGGKGLFIKEIEEALLDGRADLAVHSIKDVPADLAPGLALGCIPLREDPRDVLITRDGQRLEDLAQGARLGTSSLRRRVQLALLRPDLEVLPLRGNVDTRLRKLGEGQVDAIILAQAGLVRLSMADRGTQLLEPEQCLPAVGQGALGIEMRDGDEQTAAILAKLEDVATALAVNAERGVMRAVEGSCQLPVAAHARREGDEIWLRGLLAEPDGTRLRTRETRASYPKDAAEAARIGEALGAELKQA